MLISYFTDPRKKIHKRGIQEHQGDLSFTHLYIYTDSRSHLDPFMSCFSDETNFMYNIHTEDVSSVRAVSWSQLSPAVLHIRLQPSSSSQGRCRHRCAGNGRKMIQEGEWLPGGLCGDGGVSWGGADRGVLDRSVLDQRDGQVQVLLQRQNHTLEQEVEALETLALSHDTKTRF